VLESSSSVALGTSLVLASAQADRGDDLTASLSAEARAFILDETNQAYGAAVLIASLPVITVPAFGAPIMGVMPTVPAGATLSIPTAVLGALPIGAGTYVGLFRFVEQLIRLDEACVGAVRRWYRHFHSSASAALTRAEQEFERFIERAELLRNHAETLQEVSTLLGELSANCETAGELHPTLHRTGSQVLSGRVADCKVTVQSLVAQIEGHMSLLSMEAAGAAHLSMADGEHAVGEAGDGESCAPVDGEDGAHVEGEDGGGEDGERAIESMDPRRRKGHRQRRRANKWKASVRIRTPQHLD